MPFKEFAKSLKSGVSMKLNGIRVDTQSLSRCYRGECESACGLKSSKSTIYKNFISQ